MGFVRIDNPIERKYGVSRADHTGKQHIPPTFRNGQQGQSITPQHTRIHSLCSPSPILKAITCESSGPRKQDRMKERDLTLTLSIVDKKPPSLRTVEYSTEPLCNKLPLKAHLLRVPVFVWRGDQRSKYTGSLDRPNTSNATRVID